MCRGSPGPEAGRRTLRALDSNRYRSGPRSISAHRLSLLPNASRRAGDFHRTHRQLQALRRVAYFTARASICPGGNRSASVEAVERRLPICESCQSKTAPTGDRRTLENSCGEVTITGEFIAPRSNHNLIHHATATKSPSPIATAA